MGSIQGMSMFLDDTYPYVQKMLGMEELTRILQWKWYHYGIITFRDFVEVYHNCDTENT